MDKKKIFNRKVVAAVIVGVAGVAAALGFGFSEESQQSIINVVMMVVSVF